MNRHPYVLLIIDGMLHCCTVDEGIASMLENGRVPWRAVSKSADPEFLREAGEIFSEPFVLEGE